MSRYALLLALTCLAACACPQPPVGTATPAPTTLTTSSVPVASSVVTVHCLLRYAAFASMDDERGEEAKVLVTVVRGDGLRVGDRALSGTWAAAIGVVPARRSCPERYALFGDADAEPAGREAMLDVLREHLSRSEHAWYRPTFEAPLLAEIGANGYLELRRTADGSMQDVEVNSGSLPTAVTVHPLDGGTPWVDLRLPPPSERLHGIVDPGLEATTGLAHPVVPVIGLAVLDPISGRRLAARPGTYAFGNHWTPRDPIQVR